MDFLIKAKIKGEVVEGVLIKEDDEFVTLKLSSGYNANFRKSEVKVLSKEKIEKKGKGGADVRVDASLPKVTVLQTGGTIASKVDYATGAVSSKFDAKELLALFPELNEFAFVDARMIRNMASDDMRFEHYNVMIDEVVAAVKSGSKGVIITHGTDTLHYTSAALSYALKNLPIPVILVGAQRSSDRPSSDAFTNLFGAVKFIASNMKLDKRFCRVGVCMHEKMGDDSFLILDGINVKKLHSSRRDAFRQVNYVPAARVKDGKIEVLREELFGCRKGKFSFVKFDARMRIGFLKVHPHMFADEVKVYSKYDLVVVEGTGLGHMPISKIDEFTGEHLKILSAVKGLIENGVKVIVGVQTVFGEVNLNVYSPGRVLCDSGVLGNHMNLITETLMMRAACVLSEDKKNFDKLWKENLEGFELRSEDVEE
jgi:glutamyl-tRNA(Gln) amidotransferase subunit D